MARPPRRPERPITFRRVKLDATPDDPVVRSMLRHGTELEPDPRFARRLRGIVLSQHVATREGHVPVARRGGMTPIGRGVLVSSVLLALSAGGVGAYSQSAIPDDLLYPLKLRLESLRMAVAPPDLQDDLLAMALEERTNELARAASAGRWNAAEEAAWRVMVTERQLSAVDGLTPAVAARVDAHLHALEQVLAHAPPSAAAMVAERLTPTRAVVERRSGGNQGTPGNGSSANPQGPSQGQGQGVGQGQGQGQGQGSHGSGAPSASPAAATSNQPAATATAKPAPSRPAPSNRPAQTERPSESARPTPRGHGTPKAPGS